MENQEQYQQNHPEQGTEQRFGETAYAYDHRRDTVDNARHADLIRDGNEQGSGTDSADHGPAGTVNSGSGQVPDHGNATGGATTGDDAHTTGPQGQQH